MLFVTCQLPWTPGLKPSFQASRTTKTFGCGSNAIQMRCLTEDKAVDVIVLDVFR